MQQDKDVYNQIDTAIRSARMLIVYRDLLKDKIINDFLDLLHQLTTESGSELDIVDSYHELLHSLMCSDVPGSWADAWQRYLVGRILENENPFSLQAEYVNEDEIEPAVLEAVKRDLRRLKILFGLSAADIKQAVIAKISSPSERQGLMDILDWSGLMPSRSLDLPMAQKLYEADDWSALAGSLASHYRKYGSGQFSKYRAFRWEGNGGLIGVADPDKSPMQDLIGLENQKRQLMVNTEYFIKGLPASNVLLYGKRGTGKSSMVKSLLSEYQAEGLRLVELPKQHLQDIPRILALLRSRTFHFILFIDDLSFEEYEVEYKELKAVLEGGVEAIPDNVLVCATSNRRHLITEYFSDRKLAEEIHYDDTAQEKQSIADRFGITILFPSTNQQSYLQIVDELAGRLDLPVDKEILKRKALQWEKSHNGPSGRTARQFVDNLAAQYGVSRETIRKS